MRTTAGLRPVHVIYRRLNDDFLSPLCRRVREGVQALTGITEGTFFRDQGWHMLELGPLIERADQPRA